MKNNLCIVPKGQWLTNDAHQFQPSCMIVHKGQWFANDSRQFMASVCIGRTEQGFIPGIEYLPNKTNDVAFNLDNTVTSFEKALAIAREQLRAHLCQPTTFPHQGAPA